MPTTAEDVWIPSACSQCYSYCAILARKVNNTLVKIEGNPRSSTNRGRLCPRGVSGTMLLYDPSRVNSPLRRTNPKKGLDVDPGWVEISWDEALDTIAERLRKIREDDPRKLMAIGTVGARDQSQMGRLFSTAFGTPNNTWHSGAGNHCGNAEHLFGALLHGSWSKQPDTDHCNYLLNFGVPVGFGAYYVATGMAQRIADARCRGMRHVVVDPFLSPAAEKADEWIPIRPGTDGAFALGMLHVLLNELDLYDVDYLKHHTNGPYLIGNDGRYMRDKETAKPLVWDSIAGRAKCYDDPEAKDLALEGQYEVDGASGSPAFSLLKEHVTSFTPEWASPITTVPAATIRRIAKEFAEAARIGSTIVIEGKELPYRPAAIMYFKGAQGHKNATLTSMSIELLGEMVGSSNVPGGILGANSRCLGHPKTGLPNWGPAVGPDGLLTVQNSSFRVLHPRSGVKKPEAMSLMDMVPTVVVGPASSPIVMQNPEKFGIPYRIEMSINLGCNYPMTAADPKAIAAAFDGVFQVTSALYLNEVTYLSDIVLPDASYLERHSLIVDWNSSNAATGEWCFHVRQPIVEPEHGRRSYSEVLLDVADRMDMREDLYAVLNVALGLRGEKALAPDRKYALTEIADRYYRSLFGEEHSLEWFQQHGLLKWPKRVEEVYWKPFVDARVPIYFESFPQIGREIDGVARELGFDDTLDTSAFQALPEWRPCPSHEEKRADYDLFAIYYRIPFQSFSATYNNPWLDEVSRMDPFGYPIAINSQTARHKGIQEGDWIEVFSGTTAHSIKARAHLTEGIHPEVIAIANCGGHWSKFLPLASQPEKGACFEWLMPLDFKYVDIPSMTIDQCVRVKVARQKG